MPRPPWHRSRPRSDLPRPQRPRCGSNAPDPRFSAVSGVRHARAVVWIGRVGGIRVTYYLFAPQGRAERPKGPASSQAVNHPQHSHLRVSILWSTVGILPLGTCHRHRLFFKKCFSSCWPSNVAHIEVNCLTGRSRDRFCGCVRSLRTQQRALVKCQFIPRRSVLRIARNSFGSKSNPLGLASG